MNSRRNICLIATERLKDWYISSQPHSPARRHRERALVVGQDADVIFLEKGGNEEKSIWWEKFV